MIRHYLTLALERAGVRVDRDMESELCELDRRMEEITTLRREVDDLRQELRQLTKDVGILERER